MEVVRPATYEGSPDVAQGSVPRRDISVEGRKESTSSRPLDSERKKFDEERLKDAVEQANKLSGMFDRSLKFEYRREADIYQVSVIDTSKDEVVRKIPPDEIVRFIESIKDLFGAMLDVQA